MALNSPDFNLVDYFVCNVVQEKVYQTHVANIDKFKYRLVQVWAVLDHRHIITAAIAQWRCRLGALDTCESSRGYFELEPCAAPITPPPPDFLTRRRNLRPARRTPPPPIIYDCRRPESAPAVDSPCAE